MSYSNNENENQKNGLKKFHFDADSEFRGTNHENNGLDPKKVLGLIFRYKWLILLFLMIGATGAWFYADRVTPVYQAKGTLMINTSLSSPEDERSKLMSQTTGQGVGTTLANELQILQSRTFSRQISSALIEQNSVNINDVPILWTYDEEKNEFYKADKETVTSRIQKTIDFKQPVEEADVLEVVVRSNYPEEAAKIVNKAMEIYVENSTQQNRRAATKTTEFLDNEKQQAQKELKQSEEKLRQFMDTAGIVQINEQASKIVNRQAETETELQRVRLDLESVKQTITRYENELEKIKPGLSKQFSEAIEPRIKNLQEELAGYEKERRLIITRNPGVLDRKPVPQRLQYLGDQIGQLKSDIKELSANLFNDENEFVGINSADRIQKVLGIQNQLVELRIQQNQYESRLEALEQHKQEVDANFNTLPKEMVELAKLQRDVKLNEELYIELSRQHKGMSIWKQSQFGFGQIIDSAEVPSAPISPNKKLLLLLGLMLGGFVSAGFIVIREFMNTSVSSLNQLRTMYHSSLTLTAVPSIGKISNKNRKYFKVGEGKVPNELVMMQDRMNIASESIRRLKNNIIYQNGDTPPKTLAVTSPAKGDGKSTIVSNLGIAFADAGYNTLVIDTDFRRPKLHKYLGLADDKGLTDYLNGSIPFNQLIQTSDISSLKVITVGKKPKNPESLVGSKQFKQLLTKLKQMFDIIIIDTPPFGVVSDSAALLRESESTLVVARYRETNKGLLFRTIEELEQIKANVTNIVMNDFDHRKETDNYYGVGYFQSLYDNYYDYID